MIDELQRPANQTPEHWAIVVHAWAWLYRRGWRVVGAEVDVAGYRVDVVGVSFGSERDEVCVVECKGHRSDFLRDANVDRKAAEAIERMPELQRRAEEAREAEREFQRRNPTWWSDRDGEVAAERERLDKAARAASQRMRNAARLIDTQWHADGRRTQEPKRSKFTDPDLLASTSERYVATPAGLLVLDEVPAAWGLLEVSDDGVKIRRKSPKEHAGEPARVTKGARGVFHQLARRQTHATLERLPGRLSSGRPYPPAHSELVADTPRCACGWHACPGRALPGGAVCRDCGPCPEGRWHVRRTPRTENEGGGLSAPPTDVDEEDEAWV